MKTGRKPEPRILDPHTHPRPDVCLEVAAAFLGCDPRTLRGRIADGHITAYKDQGVYRIAVRALVAYKQFHTEAGTDAA